MTWSDLIDDYRTFHRAALATGDVDPVYPVMRGICALSSLDADQAAWLSLLHVAYYDLGSALRAHALTAGHPTQPVAELLRLPCGTERRGHRDPEQLRRHLTAVAHRCEVYGGAYKWLATLAATSDGTPTYPVLFRWLQSCPGYGRWSAYKLCELLSHTLAPYDPRWSDVAPTDMGHAYSTGPRHGLALLTPVPTGHGAQAVRALDATSAALVADLRAAGAPATAATVETTLCDFHALHAGRYYVGHDIDQMAAQLHAARHNADTPEQDAVLRVAWDARAQTLPGPYLGEHDTPPRYGVDRARTRLYRDRRVIALRVSTGTVR